ncbi:flagellar basal body L-ring protein FlgH [Mitsuaria sp. GD03876]|uniref:flagellar basal body L-ring protein FlgH n=1 Tax=Mitsuaria sp. GD03876 TaxID=2975399 RepID=UPI002448758C|nr:flagellar basal body L-ring protein FlgH [Mitsuaria sp. GD03876]MDH0867911.1 flagellar basal body L-ring protein FlgH [Mitsuaria sp. GD03876]
MPPIAVRPVARVLAGFPAPVLARVSARALARALAVGAAPMLALALGGCAAIAPPPLPSADPGGLPLPLSEPTRAAGGGVFVAGRSASLIADTRAFRAGDVLTIVLEEATQASKSANTQSAKKSGSDFNLDLNGKQRAYGINGNRDFNGSGSSTQQNTLQGAITVVVQEVTSNGLLRVHGEKSLTLNQGEELMRVAGYVRPADVDSENRVSSQRVANARIAYSGKGQLADANTPGWFTRWFNSPWNPI